MRYLTFVLVLTAAIGCSVYGNMGSRGWLWPLVILGPLTVVGCWDLVQTRHSLCRNYPLLAHLRFVQESIRPEIHQYYVESDIDGRPFSRDQRTLIYKRSKNLAGLMPFGTELDVYDGEHEWLNHSMVPRPKSEQLFRTTVGGPDCKHPYSCSIFNVSAMSFGAISPNAIMALNKGARQGGFYHCTGEGGVSRYHLEFGGDLVWQIGTGYFGCRSETSTFDPDLFREQAVLDQVKMIEVKLSQGAKPGHGGVLPAAKITPEIAATRTIPMGRDCVSPSGHSVFDSPRGLCQFIARLRELCDGKPVGFKLCVGHRHEFLAVCKAMLDTGILPDFITVDGAEGGTGAAPMEFSDSLGSPLKGGLMFVNNALIGCGLRDNIKLAASGKVASAFAIARNLAIGADWCNAARGFMMAVGCIQAQSCHTNRCPVGVATQDPIRQRALHVDDKSARVYNFHRNTMQTLTEIVAAAGLDHATELEPWHVMKHTGPNQIATYRKAYQHLQPGELLGNCQHPEFAPYWEMASAESFAAGDKSSGAGPTSQS